MTAFSWRRLTTAQADALRRQPFSPTVLAEAAAIVQDVKTNGETGLRRHAERLDGFVPDGDLVIDRAALEKARRDTDAETLALLERVAGRIRVFAEAQRGTFADLSVPVDGGHAGQRVVPVDRVGCYAPGGRFPLVSSVLMTAIPARVAGVGSVWVATPNPSSLMLAAAAVAGADAVLPVGGAQAIAALAYGAGPVQACDMVVGPGNQWVTAAKWLVAERVGIDMLAGPSELVVLADAGADPALIAADLLAQAEHDVAALPILIATEAELVDAVENELRAQQATLPTAAIAGPALAKGYAVVASLDEAVALCNRLAPEHLELLVENPETVADRLTHYGTLFVGPQSAEVFGDYGAGPNHTLPTGGAARHAAGLSVLTFLRARTWLRLEAADDRSTDDAVSLARLEGLEGHARAALRRRK